MALSVPDDFFSRQLEKEIGAVFVTLDFLAWLLRDLEPGETSADRLASVRRLAQAVVTQLGEDPPDKADLYAVLREQLDAAGGKL